MRTMTDDRLLAGLESLGTDVLGAILDASVDGVMIADVERRVVFANDALAGLAGLSADELQGRDVLEIIAPSARLAVADWFASTVAGQPGLRSSVVRRPDGSEREIEYSTMLLQVSSGPLVCAIVRDVHVSRRREREAAILARIASSLTLDQPMTTTLDAIAQSVVDATRALACAVMLIDPQDDTLALVGTAGLPPAARQALEASWPALSSHSESMRAFREQRPRITTNARERSLANPAYVALHALISAAAWDTTVSVPLVLRGRALGVLNVYYAPGAPAAEAELPLLEAIAGQAAVAVENARLFLDAEGKAVLEERQRLARELHDSVSQALYGIGLGARTARALLERQPERAHEPLEYVLQLAEAGMSEMRALIFELRPESLEREPMSSALDRLARALRARHGLAVSIDAGDDDAPEPPFEVKEALYRIVQDALHNVVTHAETDAASVTLVWTTGSVRITIRDAGRGFEPAEALPGQLGLRTMRERAHRLRGEFVVRSVPGEGTTVEVTVPLRSVQRDPAPAPTQPA